jgi:hypothetical protein
MNLKSLSPSRTPRGRTLSYLFALLAPLLTLWLRLAIGYQVGEEPMLLLLRFSVPLSAHVGGLGPGLFATALAALVSGLSDAAPPGLAHHP